MTLPNLENILDDHPDWEVRLFKTPNGTTYAVLDGHSEIAGGEGQTITEAMSELERKCELVWLDIQESYRV